MNKSEQDPTNLNLLQGKHPKTRLENASNRLNRQERTYADEWIVMKEGRRVGGCSQKNMFSGKRQLGEYRNIPVPKQTTKNKKWDF